MNEVILDASALLAFIQQEPGAKHIEEAAKGHVAISTINLAEVVTKLIEGGMSKEEIQNILPALNLTVVPFDEEMAYETANLRASTRTLGLSLGDRACLATARIRKTSVLTADKIWLRANVGVEIKCIR